MTSTDDTAPSIPSPPARLSPEGYLSAIRRESDRFVEVLATADPGAWVPSCPEWDADDLLWHLTEVQAFWAARIRSRPASPEESDIAAPTRPDTHAGLLDAFTAASTDLTGQLEGIDPAEPAWSWADFVSDGHTVGFTLRRQAHEALIHRLDAEDAAGVGRSAVDPVLAADGVAELVEVMYGGPPPSWATFTPTGGLVRVDLTDTGEALWLQPGTLAGTAPDGKEVEGPHVLDVPPDGEPAAATVSGTAAEIDVAWWKRGGPPPTTTGDADLLAALAAALDPPLD